MTEEERSFAKWSPPLTSGLVEQQRWFMESKQSFVVTTEADLFSKLDAGLASLDAGQGIPASEAFAMLRNQNG